MKSTMEIEQFDTLSDNDYAFLQQLVREHTGIVLQGERHRNMVQGRLIRRLRTLHIESFSVYCKLLQQDKNDGEMLHVINAITTNVTSFFRESYHFEHLKTILIDQATHQGNKRLRLWSAACSSGEEPYSIAMTAAEALPTLANYDLKILATDIDTNILEKAHMGQYPTSITESLPAGYQVKYTQPVSPDKVAITENIKKLVHFKPLNLLHEWPVKGPFDAIFCRNVFIYFTPETQDSIARRLVDLLKPGGFLYIGHSENLLHLSDCLEAAGRTIYRRKL